MTSKYFPPQAPSEPPRVRTDVDARKVDGTITSAQLSSTKLMKIKLDDGPTIVRHVDRVEALNTAAIRFLGR